MIKFKKTVLDNGLRVITAPLHATETTTVLVLVGAGSKYEQKRVNGISHFLEHMFFKGTKKRPTSFDISSALDSIGGHFNAYTSKEFTGYYAKVDARHTGVALDVVSDMFINSKFDKQEIEKEKGVIIEEINMVHDTPMRYVEDFFEQTLYGDQPAGWDVAGTKEAISGIKRDDFVRYLAERYVAKNTVVVVAGKFNQNDVLEKIKKEFKGVPVGNLKQLQEVKEAQSAPTARTHFKETNQAHFCFGARAYNAFDEKRIPASLLAIILGGNMSSRLFIEVREKRGLAYYVRTTLMPYLNSGYLMTQVGVDTAKLDEAIKVIFEQYLNIAKNGVGAKELASAKDYIKGTTLLGLESSDEVAAFFGHQEILKNEILLPEEKFAKIDKVGLDDIKNVAREIFRPEKLNLAIVGPFKDSQNFKKLLQ